MSLTYVGSHNAMAYLLRMTQHESRYSFKATVQSLATLSLRLAVMLWLVTCGLGVTFILANWPSCLPVDVANTVAIDVGATCIVQHAGIAASLLAL